MKAELGTAQLSAKLRYEAPVVTLQGSFESVTQHATAGSRFDTSFSAGDPVPDPLDIFS
jgi:hypothetical protein